MLPHGIDLAARLPPGLRAEIPNVSAAQLLSVLSITTGWNQTIADWQLLLTLSGAHALSIHQDEKSPPLASALALPYDDRLAWLGMVLVLPDWRGQRIASTLLHALVEQLEARSLVIGLDATEAGRSVYQRQGFNEMYTLSRLRAAHTVKPPLGADGMSIAGLTRQQITALAAWDANTFGADRYSVLAALQQRLPDCALLARKSNGEILGYILARDGRLATQLGPLVAATKPVAKALLAHALNAITGPVLIDVPDQHRQWIADLKHLGFVYQRGFVRMLKDRHKPFDDTAKIYAIGGPELA